MQLRVGGRVNVELPLAIGDRVGGHMVQGHVDTTSTIEYVDTSDGAWRVRVRTPAAINAYLLPKGSVTLNGVSLTLASVQSDTFDVALIPETLERTTWSELQAGAVINVEADMMTKAVVDTVMRMLPRSDSAETGTGITREALREAGFLHA